MLFHRQVFTPEALSGPGRTMCCNFQLGNVASGVLIIIDKWGEEKANVKNRMNKKKKKRHVERERAR